MNKHSSLLFRFKSPHAKELSPAGGGLFSHVRGKERRFSGLPNVLEIFAPCMPAFAFMQGVHSLSL